MLLIISCSTSRVTSYATNYATRAVLDQMGTTGDLNSMGLDARTDVKAFESLVRRLIKEVEDLGRR